MTDDRFEMPDNQGVPPEAAMGAAAGECEPQDLEQALAVIRHQNTVIADLARQRVELNQEIGKIAGEHEALQRGLSVHYSTAALSALLRNLGTSFPSKADYRPCVAAAAEIAQDMVTYMKDLMPEDLED